MEADGTGQVSTNSRQEEDKTSDETTVLAFDSSAPSFVLFVYIMRTP
jgi:hypothetical protein